MEQNISWRRSYIGSMFFVMPANVESQLWELRGPKFFLKLAGRMLSLTQTTSHHCGREAPVTVQVLSIKSCTNFYLKHPGLGSVDVGIIPKTVATKCHHTGQFVKTKECTDISEGRPR